MVSIVFSQSGFYDHTTLNFVMETKLYWYYSSATRDVIFSIAEEISLKASDEIREFPSRHLNGKSSHF